MLKYVLAAGIGAAALYFLDPSEGGRRRDKAREQFSEITGFASEQVVNTEHYPAHTAQELADKTAHLWINQDARPLTERPRAFDITYLADLQIQA